MSVLWNLWRQEKWILWKTWIVQWAGRNYPTLLNKQGYPQCNCILFFSLSPMQLCWYIDKTLFLILVITFFLQQIKCQMGLISCILSSSKFILVEFIPISPYLGRNHISENEWTALPFVGFMHNLPYGYVHSGFIYSFQIAHVFRTGIRSRRASWIWFIDFVSLGIRNWCCTTMAPQQCP